MRFRDLLGPTSVSLKQEIQFSIVRLWLHWTGVLKGGGPRWLQARPAPLPPPKKEQTPTKIKPKIQLQPLNPRGQDAAESPARERVSELSERRQKRGEGTDRCCPERCCATGTGRAPVGRSCRAAGSGSSASARLQHNQHPSVLRISTKTCTLTTVTHRKGVEGGRVGVTHRNRDFTSDRSDTQKQRFYFR